jgi:DNA recombination protein RmuC
MLIVAAITYLITYYILSATRVKQEDYNALQEKLSDQVNLNNQQQIQIHQIKSEIRQWQSRWQQESEVNKKQQVRIEQNQESSILLNKQIATLTANNDALIDRLQDQIKSFKVMQEASKSEFRNIAQELLEEKTKSFAIAQKKDLSEVLNPLKERIQIFENKVEATNKESIARHSSLKEQIIHLSDLNQQMSNEAKQLTNALKQDNKVQGNWGELILESILDKSGLEKDREYHVQLSLSTDEGKTYRPDVIIDLPDNKKIIIDSKVSLTAYDQLVNADTDENLDMNLAAHCLSLKKHIDGLAAKNYHDLYRIESPDFVMMFVPIETAFSIALRKDAKLYTYAFEKNIVIVTPSTLLATLKTVETIWRNDKQHRNALQIATEAGKMYDKMVALVEDLQKIGQRLGQTQESYQEAMKKLYTGKGNLIRRTEKLKQLGAKANKSLPGEDARRAT